MTSQACVDGLCVECQDTDSQNNVYVSGVLSAGSRIIIDQCSAFGITQARCDSAYSDGINIDQISCPSSTTCQNGVCVSPPATPFCYYLNANGSRMPARTSYNHLFSDMPNPGYHGIITQNGTFGQNPTLECSNGNVIRPVCGATSPYMSAENVNQGTILYQPCSNGCSAGSCISPPINLTTNVSNQTSGNSTCTDTDGYNIHAFGTTRGRLSYSGAPIVERTDYCGIEPDGRQWVAEFYCNVTTDRIGSSLSDCPLGCYSGACIPTQTCTDSDGGSVATIGGVARTNSSSVPEDRRVLTDSCQNSTFLNETICYSSGSSAYPWWTGGINCVNSTNGFTCIDPDGQAGPIAAYCG
ncbi:MAG: hypothetical protein Q7K45_05505 [Nanoarchaeota archaeon]|nr:hypothetical protein [Nanoarchaeota archaeon]